MSQPSQLLTVRNLILAAAAVFGVSLLGMCISMLRPNDSDGRRRDSYGTRAGGYRALFELLESLDVPVTRSMSPPIASDLDNGTLVLLNPDPFLVGTGPRYFQALDAWVEQGGRVVVTPTPFDEHRSKSMLGKRYENVLQLLNVSDQVSLGPLWSNEEQSLTEENDSPFDFGRMWSRTRKLPPPAIHEVIVHGELKHLRDSVKQLAITPAGVATLDVNPAEIDGYIAIQPDASDSDEPVIIAAAVNRGQGQILVVSDASLFSNYLLAHADNSVLAAYSLHPVDGVVAFDEFFHGLAVRGNPFYLLTRPGFAATALGLTAIVAVLAWRASVFLGPPLPERRSTRRDIGEYVDAMSRFLSRGTGSSQFLIREVRDGVLRQLCRDLKIPAETPELDKILSALSRRSPAQARQLESAVEACDVQLRSHNVLERNQIVPVSQRLMDCL